MFQQENRAALQNISAGAVTQAKKQSVGTHIMLPDTGMQQNGHSLQEMADNSPQVQQNKQYQSMANANGAAPVQKKAVSPAAGLGGSSQVIQLLRDEYTFNNAGFEADLTNEARGVYRFTADGEQVVVKYGAPATEIGLTKLAIQAGLGAPAIRSATATELQQLAVIPRVRMRVGNAAVMEFVPGDKLEFLNSDVDDRNNAPFFTPDVLRQIGRSYAFQLLTESADRWPSPVQKGEGTMTAGNSGNVMLAQGPGGPALKDIDLTPTELTDGYAEQLRDSFRSLVQNANGGTLVRNVVDMIRQRHNADYTIPEDNKRFIVEGMTATIQNIDQLDVAAAGLAGGYREKMQGVRQVFREELERERLAEEARARARAEEEAQQKKCCFITTACTEAKGLPDDCDELTVLRKFRDDYLLQQAKGPELFALYYNYSPKIVTAIRRREDEEEILRKLYGIICECVSAIKQNDPKFAYHTYCRMTLELTREFIPHNEIDLSTVQEVLAEIA